MTEAQRDFVKGDARKVYVYLLLTALAGYAGHDYVSRDEASRIAQQRDRVENCLQQQINDLQGKTR